MVDDKLDTPFGSVFYIEDLSRFYETCNERSVLEPPHLDKIPDHLCSVWVD